MRDGGARPAARAGKRAYTIIAENNGPDVAPSVRVSGLPRGITEFDASEGSYDPGSGVRTISNLDTGPSRRCRGKLETPTLTLVTDSAVPITATIENTQDYCVRIKTSDPDVENDLECVGSLPSGYTEHSGNYLDYIEKNNSATIEARWGTGETPPGAPQNWRTAIIHHDAAGGDYGGVDVSPVTVNIIDGAPYSPAPGLPDRPTPGSPDSATPGAPPKVAMSVNQLLLSEAGGQGIYTVLLNSVPSEPLDIVVASSAPGAARLQAGQGSPSAQVTLRFTPANWNDIQTVTVIGQNDNRNNPNNQRISTIIHTATGSGYNGDPVGNPVVVTVVDSDGSADIRLSKTKLYIPEDGDVSYGIKLNSQPTSPVTVFIENGDDDFYLHNYGNQHQWQSGIAAELVFTPSNWHTEQIVFVHNIVGSSGTHILRHHTESDDPKYNNKPGPSAQLVRTRKATVTLSAPSTRIFEGGPGKITASIDGNPLPYGMTVFVYLNDIDIDMPDGVEYIDGNKIAITIPAGRTSKSLSFTAKSNIANEPNDDCQHGYIDLPIWFDQPNNYTVDDLLSPATILTVWHRDYAPGGKCAGR